jgi:hypothetical protein
MEKISANNISIDNFRGFICAPSIGVTWDPYSKLTLLLAKHI